MEKKVVLCWVDDAGPYKKALAAAGQLDRIELLELPRAEQPQGPQLEKIHAVLAWDSPPGLLASMPKLEWVQSQTVAAEAWLAKPDLGENITLTVARGVHQVQMPENILGSLFWITKPFRAALANQADARWERQVGEPLAGKTLCIIGLGTIGREVARKASLLDLRVVGVDRVGKPVPHVDEVFVSAQATQAISQADFVVVLIPQTPANENFINAERLKAFKPSAWLLNFSRGAIVDDEALIQGLAQGLLKGAVLDVFRQEPLPSSHPFWTTPGIFVLPHIGGMHPRRDELVADLFADNVKRWLDGQPLRAVVDRELGY